MHALATSLLMVALAGQQPDPAVADLQRSFPKLQVKEAPKPVQPAVGARYLITWETEIYPAGGSQGGTPAIKGAKSRSNEPPSKPVAVLQSTSEMFVVPSRSSLTKEGLRWEALPMEHYAEPVFLGQREGRDYFARIPIFQADLWRTKMRLEGGEDLVALNAKGLFVKDPERVQGISRSETTTNTSCVFWLATKGEAAVAAIERELPLKLDSAWYAFMALGKIEGAASTRLLNAYFNHPDKKVRAGVRYGLVQRLREDGKEMYAVMLAENSYPEEAARAAASYGWGDLHEEVKAAYDRAIYPYKAKDLLTSLRKLEGSPIDDLEKQFSDALAASSAGDPARAAEAKAAIQRCSDHEAVVVFALALNPRKGNGSVTQELAKEILDQRPTVVVEAQRRRFEEAAKQAVTGGS